MRKIISGFASSLDGYITAENGAYDWIIPNKEIDFKALYEPYDTFFYGRKTYESVIQVGVSKAKGISHYVFSNSLESPQPPFQLISGPIHDHVMAIKSKPGKDIAVFGGAHLLAALLDLKLVDEIHISVIPVLLGSGLPMVSRLKERIPLELKNTKTYSNGTVALHYHIPK